MAALVGLAAGLFCPRIDLAQTSADVYKESRDNRPLSAGAFRKQERTVQASSEDDARYTETVWQLPILMSPLMRNRSLTSLLDKSKMLESAIRRCTTRQG
jgi:hypothetical protein